MLPTRSASRSRSRARRAGGIVLGSIAAITAVSFAARTLYAWGEAGHRLTGQAAAAALPAEMPAFFRDAGAQLAYLNPDPDRWRERGEREEDKALDGATAPDHFIDLEMIPAARQAGALAAPDRFAYVDSLQSLGLHASNVGLLPYRIVELTQRLRVEFRLWRAAPNNTTRTWIEQRIINDAGLLGHYVADGSNPLHTSVQFNGWTGPNPNGYATDKRMHSRFESSYVQTHITIGDVQSRVAPAPRVFAELRPAVVAYLMTSSAQVETLYAIDKRAPFNIETTAAENKEFTAARLAAGAAMLRDLWWTAWVTSSATH